MCAMIWASVLLGPVLLAGPQPAEVTGTALYRERIAMPPGAVFEVTLEEAGKPGAQPVILGQMRKTDAGQPPYAFTISYDKAKIRRRRTYVVKARLLLDGRPRFESEAVRVLTRGKGRDAGSVLMRGVRPSSLAAPAPLAGTHWTLAGTHWTLAALAGKPVTLARGQKEPYLVFHNEDKRAGGFTGCNQFSASYKTSAGKLSFGHGMGTLMACAQGMELEDEFRKALPEVKSYRIEGERLELLDGAGKALAGFEAKPRP